MEIKGYKVFNSDWTCKEQKFQVGKTYTYKGKIKICESGFHLCTKLADCFLYYPFDSKNKVAVVTAIGKTQTHPDDSKVVADRIKIEKELSWHEVLNLCNIGKDNTGFANTGHRNSGYGNSGYRNSGDRNSGDRNSGYGNSGDRNSGDRNSGYGNSGDRNSGDWNSGDFNSCDYSSGVFNSKEQKIYMFNRMSDWTYCQWINSDAKRILTSLDLHEYDKEGVPIKIIPYKEAWQNLWKNLTKEEKQAIYDLPNFSWEVFAEITGIEKERD